MKISTFVAYVCAKNGDRFKHFSTTIHRYLDVDERLNVSVQHYRDLPTALSFLRNNKGLAVMVAVSLDPETLNTFANGEIYKIDAALKTVLGDAELIYLSPGAIELSRWKRETLRRPDDMVVNDSSKNGIQEIKRLLNEALSKRSGGVSRSDILRLQQQSAISDMKLTNEVGDIGGALSRLQEDVKAIRLSVNASFRETSGRIDHIEGILVKSDPATGFIPITEQILALQRTAAANARDLKKLEQIAEEFKSLQRTLSDKHELQSKIIDSLLSGGMMGKVLLALVGLTIALAVPNVFDKLLQLISNIFG